MRRALMLMAAITGTLETPAMAQTRDVAGERYTVRAAEAERAFGGPIQRSVQTPARSPSALHWNSGTATHAAPLNGYREPNPFQVRNTTNPFQLRNTTNPFRVRNTANPLHLRNTQNPLQRHR
jgi:hypothetical protein